MPQSRLAPEADSALIMDCNGAAHPEQRGGGGGEFLSFCTCLHKIIIK